MAETAGAPVYVQKIRVRSSDVTVKRVMRISTLLKYIQEGTVRHTTELGMGREMTLDRGLLWIITQQHLTIRRLPGYDEEITLKTWPGAQLHLFFPRYTSIVDKAGEEIISARTLWALMDEKTRRPVFPQKYGVRIEGASKRGDFPLPRVASLSDGDMRILREDRTALFSECDINGHMNNSEYFDLFDDMLQEYRSSKSIVIDPISADRLADASGAAVSDSAVIPPYEISAEYIDEIPYETKYQALLCQSKTGYLLQGSKEEKVLFRIRLVVAD